MKTWTAIVQYNGEDVTIYDPVEFEITDELYKDIQDAIESNISLKECMFYNDLYNKALAISDLDKYIEIWEDEPERDEFDGDDEFQEAMDQYQQLVEEKYDEYCLADVSIYDPGEFERFRQHFLGKQYKHFVDEDEDGADIEFEIDENYDRITTTTFTVSFDENGFITDIKDIYTEGMESDGVRGGSFSECHPDYELLIEELTQQLEEDMDDEEAE